MRDIGSGEAVPGNEGVPCQNGVEQGGGSLSFIQETLNRERLGFCRKALEKAYLAKG